ncbi:Acyl-coenzyme A thioesterase 9, mitochondrial [Lamellibrachia satsuma]|nr:Acyl-coenzyme A thioesterase 9, mitochondrial [Lamellibrachia satsuma]
MVRRRHTSQLLDRPDGMRVISIHEAHKELSQVLIPSAEMAPSLQSSLLPSSQSELPARRMLDSYREVCLCLSKDMELRRKYATFNNFARLGRIMEDLDTLSGVIAYTHTRRFNSEGMVKKSPRVIVTAAVDKIDIHVGGVLLESDVHLRGHVTWVGRTSMEITMRAEQRSAGQCRRLIDANFTMVATDPTGQRKAYVNPLKLETQEEEELFVHRNANRVKRKEDAIKSLMRMPPSEEERNMIHDMFIKSMHNNTLPRQPTAMTTQPAGSIWMADTVLNTVLITFPEDQNLHGKIFGGFLIREAFELGWANAWVYSRSQPLTVAMADIKFRQSVKIGSLLYLSSQVVYTRGPFMQVIVHAEVVNAETGQRDTTHVFHFTFKNRSGPVPPTMPHSYAEYMLYLEGKRTCFSCTPSITEHPNGVLSK